MPERDEPLPERGEPSPRFTRALEAMRGADPEARENGFDFLREHADAFVDDLVAEFGQQTDDGVRALLLELISEARSPSALPVLVAQLASDDESLRFWAVRGLEMLDTREAEHELSLARSNGWIG